MATSADFERELMALDMTREHCTKLDLQLAAELGKNLLARNKELENSVKQCHNIIEEQAQEIEYLSKQTTALRKANDNRIRIYEQLEVSIQELERANQRLALDNSTDKKQIKSLCAYRDTLEARCDELQKDLDESRVQQTVQKEKLKRLTKTSAREFGGDGKTSEEDMVNDLIMQNQELKRQKSRDQRKITDLEDEISRINQDMALLEEELSTLYQKEEYVKNLQEEISALEEVRSGNLCGKCMKEMDPKMEQVQMILDPEEEDEDASVYSDKNPSDAKTDVKEENPYRTLVEKYEALMEEQSKNKRHCHRLSAAPNCLSLQDELKQFGDKNSLNSEIERDEGSEDGDGKGQRKDDKRSAGQRKIVSTTPTDFSEAETSSSGFSDETSNKATQTERNLAPGSFLCSIADGDDCKFSIYDDACPIESRFRKTPEYRTLFREIFAVLKRAAEAKDDGEQLPLLDDLTPITEIPKVPPVTPAKEEAPCGFDELQSLPDSVATSDASTADIKEAKSETKSKVPQEPAPGTSSDSRPANTAIDTLSVTVSVKKSRGRSNNSPGRRGKGGDHVEGSPRNSPRRSGRRRKEWRSFDSPRTQSPAVRSPVLTTLERRESPNGNKQQKANSVWEYQRFVSTAFLEVAELKKLDKSYAEVLRQPPKTFNRATRKAPTSLMK